MNILAIDTTAPFFSFSYKSEEKPTYHYLDNKQWQHAERLLVEINEIIPDFAKLDHLVISRGPGGFTGLRVGLAIAKAFKIALPQIKIITPSHFQVIAHQYFKQNSPEEVMVVIDAKRGEVVMQRISKELKEIGEMKNILAANIEASLLENERKIITDSDEVKILCPSAGLIDCCTSGEVLELGRSLLSKNHQASLSPIYFRPSDAKLPAGFTQFIKEDINKK